MTPTTGHVDVYFFISHVRTTAPNKWITDFYNALKAAVESRAEPKAGLRPESIYLETQAIANARLSAGDLPSARVFVPLYTREFLHKVPPDFERYLSGELAGSRPAVIHPVLWDGDSGIRNAPGLAQARDLGDGIAIYEERGLAAMCRLNTYAADYGRIIDRLAERIVTAAEDPGKRPAWAGEDESARIDTENYVPFLISVLSPYGRQWNPFGDTSAATLADHTAEAARNLRLPPSVAEYRMTAEPPSSPGVLLVDIWALDHERFRSHMREILPNPQFRAHLVIVAKKTGDEDESRLRELVTMVREMAREPINVVSSRLEFDRVIGEVLRRNKSNYLRSRAIRRSPGM